MYGCKLRFPDSFNSKVLVLISGKTSTFAKDVCLKLSALNGLKPKFKCLPHILKKAITKFATNFINNDLIPASSPKLLSTNETE